VTEPSENRVGRGVGNNGENCADCERGSAVIVSRKEDCSRATSCSNCHRAADCANTFERASVDLHRARPGGGAGGVLNHERAFADSSASGSAVSPASPDNEFRQRRAAYGYAYAKMGPYNGGQADTCEC